MPKHKTVDKTVAEPAAAAEVKKRSRSAATKPNTPAATHKRASKKNPVETPAVAAAPIAASVPTPAVEEIAPVKIAKTPTYDEIATLAYSYWEARGHQGGSAEEDWCRAERALLELA